MGRSCSQHLWWKSDPRCKQYRGSPWLKWELQSWTELRAAPGLPRHWAGTAAGRACSLTAWVDHSTCETDLKRSLFLWKSWYFSQDSLITKELKIAAFIWNRNLYYTLVNVITVILDQFNAALLYYLKKGNESQWLNTEYKMIKLLIIPFKTHMYLFLMTIFRFSSQKGVEANEIPA